ncbi:V-type ATPase, D subunit protein, partial [Toxoplasma gondii TgCatPRC2]
MPQDIRPAPNR